jgi:hypothetical protein
MERLMSYRSLFALSIQAILVAGGGAAYAGGPVNNDSDILGIKLSMTRDQARNVIAAAFPGPSVEELPVELGTDMFKKSAVAGFIAQASGGDFGRESVSVLFNPNDNATDIFAVSRFKEFPKSSVPVASALVASLIEKYGQPARAADHGAEQLLAWAAPGVLERTDRSPGKCDRTSGDFYYEFADRNYVGGAFVSMMNLIASKNPGMDYSKCGTILQIQYRLASDKAHVEWMKERLIDLTKSTSEMAQFSNDFWSKADAAQQAKISKDTQNKPKL